MRELLAEVHHRAWLATAVAGGLAVACAALRLPLAAATAALATGALLIWISEEKHRLVAAMAPGQDPVPAPVLPPVPAPAAPRGSAVPVREWANPFPASRPTRRQRQQGRRAGGRRQGGA
jgi:hypothetical protein